MFLTDESSRPKNLVVAPATAEKLLLSQAMLADIKSQYPKAQLHLMVTENLAGLAKRFMPVKKVWLQPAPKASWKTFWQAGLAMQGKKFTQAWVIPERFKPGIIPAIANVPWRIGYRGFYRYALLIDIRIVRKDLHPQQLDKYRALAWDIGADFPPLNLPKLKVKPKRQAKLAEKFKLPLDKPLLAYSPSRQDAPASSQAVALGLEEEIQLVTQLQEAGWQVVIFASQQNAAEIDLLLQHPAARQLKEQAINLCGQLSWTDAVDLLALCSAQVSHSNAQALLGASLHLPVYLPAAPTALLPSATGSTQEATLSKSDSKQLAHLTNNCYALSLGAQLVKPDTLAKSLSQLLKQQ